MPDTSKPTQFKKGVPRHPNAGRRAGTPNVTTRLVREAVIEAAAQHGDDGRGKDGLIGCCKYICRENPAAFAGLLAKVLTAQVRLQHDKTLTVALEDLKLVAKEMKEVGLSPESLLGKHVDS
jgi:hypothetical protein